MTPDEITVKPDGSREGRMGELKPCPFCGGKATWTDLKGNRWFVPSNFFKTLRASKFKTHAQLRDFIFVRDDYTCKICGANAKEKQYPFYAYSVEWKKQTFLVIDHVVSIAKGGNHHPQNLQTLCDSCNCRKR